MTPRIRLGVAVVSTAARSELLRDTMARVDDGEWIDRIIDRAPGLTPNHLAAWQHLGAVNGATHGLLIQDDVDASQGWREAAESFASRFPRQGLVSLFTGRAPVLARPEDRFPAYVRVQPKQWLGDVAVMMPVPTIRQYIDWVRTRAYQQHVAPPQFLHHDLLLRAFHQHEARTRYVFVADPPVFQHLGDTTPDPIMPGGRPAQARHWKGHDWDAASYFRDALITA